MSSDTERSQGELRLKYEELLKTKSNSKTARELLNDLSQDWPYWGGAQPFTGATTRELEPFLKLRSKEDRETAAQLLACSSCLSKERPDLLLSLIAAEKEGEILWSLLLAAGSYSELREYLEEQCIKQKKPKAKAGALRGLYKMLGANGAKFFAWAMNNKAAMRGYGPRSTAATLLFSCEDFTHVSEVADFTIDILSYDRESGPDSTFISALGYLYKSWSPKNADEILRAFNFIRDVAWEHESALSEDEKEYLKLQYDFFKDLQRRRSGEMYLKNIVHCMKLGGIPENSKFPPR